MAPKPLTVIAKIKPREEEALKQVLEKIGSDLTGNPYLRFPESRKTHFMRFAIINDPDNGPRLLFAGNYDGSLESYLDELIEIGPGIDQIWNKCEGYPGKQDFLNFIRQHSHKAQTIFIAFRDETVESLRNKIAIRQHIQKFLDLKEVADSLDYPGIKPFLDRVSKVPKDRPWWKVLGLSGLRVLERLGAVVDRIWDLIGELILSVLRLLGKFLGAPDRRRQIGEYTGVKVDIGRTRAFTLGEDLNRQNHLHLVSTIKPGRLCRLRFALFSINFAFRFLFPPGSLDTIQSIHFAHWVIFDRGKRLLFVTHYDGSWDNYLGDFADRASDGLNSIWNNVEGYPEAGAQDVAAFKQFFRNDQQPLSQVFYAAYPEVTIKNILRDREISRRLAANFDREATEQWLELL